MSQTRLPQSHESLFQFIASSERFIHEKDAYLDELVSHEAGRKFVQEALEQTSYSISRYEKMRVMSIWAQEKNDKDIVSMKMHVCKYVQHHLTAALNRLKPTAESIYYYLLNPERNNQDKYAYLRTLTNKDNGKVILMLVKDFAKKRQQAMESLFGVDAAHFEPDMLGSYPAVKLSAKDVRQLLQSFKPMHKKHYFPPSKYAQEVGVSQTSTRSNSRFPRK